MTNFVPGPALALRGKDKKNNKKGNNEEEDDEGMDDDEGECTVTRIADPHHFNADPDPAFFTLMHIRPHTLILVPYGSGSCLSL
jgi:hypothetical protein